MAGIGELNTATTYFWLNGKMADPVDIVNKASALLWKLMGNAVQRENWEVKAHETVDGGLMVKVPIVYGTANSGSYGAQTVINQSKQQILDAARFRWAGAYGSNTLDLEDLTKCTGDEALIDISKQKINSMIKGIRTNMASQVIAAAANADSINGLGDLFNTTAATEYGSLAEASFADWKANVITTEESIGFEVMQKIFRQPAMGDFAELKPNFCCTTELLRDGYERSLHPQQRYADTEMVQAGWNNIMHKGAPIVADVYVATGVMYALNLNCLELRSHKDYNFTTPVWLDKAVLGQPDVLSANTRWRGNLYCSNRKLQVEHTNLKEPT